MHAKPPTARVLKHRSLRRLGDRSRYVAPQNMQNLQQLVANSDPSDNSIALDSTFGYPTGSIFFGHPPNEKLGRHPLRNLPDTAEHFTFLLDSNSEPVSAFAESEYPAQTVALQIGSSGTVALEYSDSISILAETTFPKLESLELGLTITDVNFTDSHGVIGELSGIIEKCPALSSLGIYGTWNLNRRVDLTELEELNIQVPHYGDLTQCPPITQSSLTNLLSSKLPISPSFFAIHLHPADDFLDRPMYYQIPDDFFNWIPVETIEIFGLSGSVAPGTIERFKRSQLATRIRIENIEMTISRNLTEPKQSAT